MQLTSKKVFLHETIYTYINGFYTYKSQLKEIENRWNKYNFDKNKSIIKLGLVFLNNDILRMDIYVEKH